MDAKFWLDRWRRNDIGFHRDSVNPQLERWWPDLGVESTAPVLVPLCGKTRDMAWLAQRQHGVIGVELSALAIDAFYSESSLSPTIDHIAEFTRYQAARHTILQGNLFDLTVPVVGEVGAVFDRGALVALEPGTRAAYVDHLLRVIAEDARLLVLVVEYDQQLVAGPPHCVLPEEMALLYGDRCEIELLESVPTADVPPHFSAQGVRSIVNAAYRIRKIR